MNGVRPTTEAERLALKAAVRRALRMSGGGASVQHATRVGEAELSRYAGAEHADRHCPLDVALDLDREAGVPVILAALAAAEGYGLAPLAQAPGAVKLSDIPAITDPVAVAVRRLAEALADGAVSGKESADIVAAVDTALKPLLDLRARAEGGAR